MEEGKDSVSAITRTSLARVLPLRLLHMVAFLLAVCFTFSVISIGMIKHFTFHIVSESPIPLGCDLKQKIEPHSNLTRDDVELFWRARLASKVKNHRSKRVPKIAFMFLTKGPLPLAPLWERFFKGHGGLYSIYIHSDPMYRARYPPSSVFYKRQIRSQAAQWGMITMCDAERRLLANALLDTSNEHFVLLSEACIPLYNFTVVHKYITGSKHSFMSSYDDPGPDGQGRYSLEMLPLVNLSDWKKGSQWFEINRQLALYIIEDTEFYPKFANYCQPHSQPPCYADEHYFQTMLTMRAGGLLANRTLTLVDFSEGGAHPATFSDRDVAQEWFFDWLLDAGDECLYNGEVIKLCHLFARKFPARALEALLASLPRNVSTDREIDR